MTDVNYDGLPRCRSTYTSSGFTWRCTSEVGHDGKHVGVVHDPEFGDWLDAEWKSSDTGAAVS